MNGTDIVNKVLSILPIIGRFLFLSWLGWTLIALLLLLGSVWSTKSKADDGLAFAVGLDTFIAAYLLNSFHWNLGSLGVIGYLLIGGDVLLLVLLLKENLIAGILSFILAVLCFIDITILSQHGMMLSSIMPS